MAKVLFSASAIKSHSCIALPRKWPASCSSLSSSDHPFHVATRSRVGSQSSSLMASFSPLNGPVSVPWGTDCWGTYSGEISRANSGYSRRPIRTTSPEMLNLSLRLGQWRSQDFKEGGAKRGRERARSARKKFYRKPHPYYDVTGGETELCCRLSPALSIIP